MMFIGLFFMLLVLRINGQNTCADRRAVCVNIRNCPSLIEFLRGPRPLSQETLAILRKAQCGFDGSYPMVCCINQDIPLPVPPRGTSPPPTPPLPPVRPVTQTSGANTGASEFPDVRNHPNLRLLDHQLCGPTFQRKVFGGNKTNVFEYPWMALINYDTGRGKTDYRCGGTVINRRYILTAAHCVTNLPGVLKLIGVRVGDHDISTERDCDRDQRGAELQCSEKYQDFGVESAHFHPQYTPTKLQNDIALIRLSSNVDFRPLNARPICLPFGSVAKPTQNRAIVTGWGATEFGPRSQDLLQAKLPIITNEQCADIFKSTAQIWQKQICAGGDNMIDSCNGDSGGPLQSPAFYPDRKVRMVQYGVVSFGRKRCGTVGSPGVYTNVAYYVDWILDTIRN